MVKNSAPKLVKNVLTLLNNNDDYFCVYIQALMVDYMESEKKLYDLFRLPGLLSEYWYFKRIGDEFYLDYIEQIDEVNSG